jgi:hypothetical protein
VAIPVKSTPSAGPKSNSPRGWSEASTPLVRPAASAGLVHRLPQRRAGVLGLPGCDGIDPGCGPVLGASHGEGTVGGLPLGTGSRLPFGGPPGSTEARGRSVIVAESMLGGLHHIYEVAA